MTNDQKEFAFTLIILLGAFILVGGGEFLLGIGAWIWGAFRFYKPLARTNQE